MVKDYGVQRHPRRTFGVIAAVLFVGAGVALGAQQVIQHHEEGVAEYRAWMVAGTPCRSLPTGAFDASSGQTPQVTNFGGVRIAREHGAAQCHEVASDGGKGDKLFPICQFDHPGRIEVSTRSGLYWFSAGYVSPATVAVQNNTPSCVVGVSQDFGHQLIYDKPQS